MARFSAEDFTTEEESGALRRISQALRGLISSLVNSLEEFQNVENTLKLETTAGIGNGLDEHQSVEAKPELLLIAGTLKEMVGTMMSDVKANAGAQKLLPVILDSGHGFFQDLTISKQLSRLLGMSSPGEESAVCIPNNKRAAKGQVICRHSCDYHPELVDPSLWRTLPQELVEQVFAKLPWPQIVALGEYSDLLKSFNFREACSESHPKLFGILRWDNACQSIWTTMHDIKSKEWFSYPLVSISGNWSSTTGDTHDFRNLNEVLVNEAYMDSMHASDEGLVCLVPHMHPSAPILVCNPLTRTWKALPPLPRDSFKRKRVTVVQLVVEDDSKWYRVILVSRERVGGVFSVHCYYSKTGVWSIMDSGLVYGAGTRWKSGLASVPYVFDCTTKTLFDLRLFAARQRLNVSSYSMVKDRLIVLHQPTGIRRQDGIQKYLISQYTWDSSVSDLRQLEVLESNVRVFPDPYVRIFLASHGFFLLIAKDGEMWHDNHHQQIGLYDVSANRWCVPPPILDCGGVPFRLADLKRWFMCELRWNITP